MIRTLELVLLILCGAQCIEISNNNNNNTISKSKCFEYSLIAHSLGFSTCTTTPMPLIVGGNEVNEREYPHVALIGFGDGLSEPIWECGGTLISENFVLSAAHCTESKENGKACAVKLGTISRDYDGPNLQVREIKETIIYPDYKTNSKYHDIALFKLKDRVIFTEHVLPACLYFSSSLPYDENINPTAAGFGKTVFTNSGGSEKLMQVELPLLTNEECEKYYKNFRRSTLKEGLTENMICAGILTGGKDACQGDSGGPLQIPLKKPYCVHAILGVISFGKFCGYAKSPAIYTNVIKYVPWIEQHIWKQEYDFINI